jgi:hypothetical protein
MVKKERKQYGSVATVTPVDARSWTSCSRTSRSCFSCSILRSSTLSWCFDSYKVEEG